ncbi:MAG: PHP domain-containing protein, partial [Bacilli bacterium]
MNQNPNPIQILLEQIKWPSEWAHVFEDATLKRVNVSKANETWTFELQLKSVLPFEVYELFEKRMQQAFQVVKGVQFTIATTDHATAHEHVPHYHNALVLRHFPESPFRKIVLASKLVRDGQQFVIQVKAEVEGDHYVRQYAPVLQEAYTKCGFPQIMFGYRVTEDYNFASIQEQVEQEDRRRAEAIEQQKAQQERLELQVKQKAEDAPDDEGPLMFGKLIKPQNDVRPLFDITEEERGVTVAGYIFGSETRVLRNGRTLLEIKLTDYSDSIVVKVFSRDDDDARILKSFKKGLWVKVKGNVQFDTFSRELVIMANDVNELEPLPPRVETYKGEKRRIELHAHTNMSQMDALPSASKLVSTAKRFGHVAVAVTDHSVAQSFPEAYGAGKKNGIKVLYGCEMNLASSGNKIAYDATDASLEELTYIVFDVETTGLSARY